MREKQIRNHDNPKSLCYESDSCLAFGKAIEGGDFRAQTNGEISRHETDLTCQGEFYLALFFSPLFEYDEASVNMPL
jgi:hypothetical protein